MSISIDINPVKVEYPVLRKAVDSELVVLFTDEHTGVVVVANNLWCLGQYYDAFACPKAIDWVKVEGTIRG